MSHPLESASQPNQTSPLPYKQLVLDWDGTITVDDTTALIGRSAIGLNRSSDDASAIMEECVNRYFEDYGAWKEKSQAATPRPGVNEKPSVQAAIEAEIARLDSSASVESRSFLRVRRAAQAPTSHSDGPASPAAVPPGSHSSYLAHMHASGAAAVRSGAVRIRDRAGLARLLRWAGAEATDTMGWSIVSVSWSRAFIVGALTEIGLVPDTPEGRARAEARVWANELLGPLESEGDDAAGLHLIQTAGAKRETLRRVVAGEATDGAVDDAAPERRERRLRKELARTVYVGDSTTDLGCLTAAGLGVYMRDESVQPDDDKLRRKLLDLNIECSNIKEVSPIARSLQSAELIDREIRLCWATDFQQIYDLLERNHER